MVLETMIHFIVLKSIFAALFFKNDNKNNLWKYIT